MSGLFITFEGGDGSGKSTQAGLLAEWLGAQGRRVVQTREPGGSPLGVHIRRLIQHYEEDPPAARAEALLYAADRAHHIATVVRPALAAGTVVLQDRYLDSSVAYQGAGRVLDPEEVRGLSLWAAEGLLPDLTVLLDLDVDASLGRVAASRDRYDRLESEARDFHERVRVAYLGLAAAEPERFLVLDASLSVDELASAIRERVGPLN